MNRKKNSASQLRHLQFKICLTTQRLSPVMVVTAEEVQVLQNPSLGIFRRVKAAPLNL